MNAHKVEAVDASEDQAIEAVRDTSPAATEAEQQDDMPLPTEPRTFFLGGLFLLALLASLYVASAIVLPVVLAIVLKLLLQPLVRLSDRLGVPHGLSATLAILLLTLSLAALVSGVAGAYFELFLWGDGDMEAIGKHIGTAQPDRFDVGVLERRRNRRRSPLESIQKGWHIDAVITGSHIQTERAVGLYRALRRSGQSDKVRIAR
jgi:hypothetical protein